MSWFNDISVKKVNVASQAANDQYIIAIHDPEHFNYSGIYTVSLTNGTDTYQFDLDITGSTSPTYDAVSCKVVNIMSSAGVGISDSLADFNANFDFNIVDDGSNRNFVTLTFKNAAFMGGNFDMSIDNKIPSGMEWTSLVDYLGKDYSTVSGAPFSDDTLLSPLKLVGGGGSPALTTPTLTTTAASSVGMNSMVLNGTLDSLGSETSVTVKFTYSINSGAATTVTATGGASVTATGSFSYTLTGLSAGDAVTFKILAVGLTNSGNDGAGTNLSATTSSLSAPTVTTSAANSLTSNSMTLNANLTSLGSETSVNVYFNYRVQGSGSAYTSTAPVNKTATGTFTFSLTGLVANTTYEYYATAAGQTNAGNNGTSSPNSTGLTTSLTLDANTFFNITGAAGTATSTALTAASIPSVTNGAIASNTVVANADNCVSQTVEVAQGGGDPDWVAIKPVYQLKPNKFGIDAATTNASLVLTHTDPSMLSNGSKVWVDDAGTMKEVVLGAVVEINNSGVWTSQTSGVAAIIRGVATNASGRTVAVTSTGLSLVSTDNGVTWSSNAIAGAPNLMDVCVSPSGTFCAVGIASKVFTSTDGITWTTRAVPGSIDCRAVTCNSLGIFIIVGTSGGSFDSRRSVNGGVTWVYPTTGVGGAGVLTGVSTLGALIYASGDYANNVYRSLDSGDNWTAVTTGAAALSAYDIAIDSSGVICLAITGGNVFSSGDSGVTWIPHSLAVGVENITAIKSTPSGFYAGTSSGNICLSADGITWGAPVATSGFQIHAFSFNGSIGYSVQANGKIYTTTVGYKYTCTSISAGYIGTVPLTAAPTVAYKGGQIFQSDLYTTTGSPSFTNDTISAVTRSSDTLTITCAQRSESGANRFAAEKVTINKGDTMIQYSAGLYE